MNEHEIKTFSGDVLFSVWTSFGRDFERVRKAATKLGTRFELTVSAPFGKLVKRGGAEIAREFVHVELVAEIPRIAGWTFAAAVDHVTEGGNLLRISPRFADALPASFRTDKATCDHCGCNRNRVTTYALRNGAGEWKRVGSNCLVDFLGHGDAVALAEMTARLDGILSGLYTLGCEDGEGGEPRGPRYEGTRSWVALAFRTIAHMGAYVSGSAAQLNPRLESTKMRMERHLHPAPGHRDRDCLPEITDAEEVTFEAQADAALAWLTGEVAAKPTLSDFEHNLVVIAKSECISGKHLGIAAYIPEAFRRHLGIIAERKAAAESGTVSEWLGAEGAKVEFDFTLTAVRSSESPYGTTYWYAGVSGSNRVTVKGSNDYFTGTKRGVQVEPEIGSKYRVKATVKKCETFRDIKSTVVTHARVAPVS